MVTLFTARSAADIKECLDRGDHIDSVNDDGYTPFNYFCNNNNIEVASALIDFGCDVDYDEALCVVVENGYSELLVKLFEYAAFRERINSPVKFCGDTPLLIACELGYTDIFDILIAAGANYTLTDYVKQTPLMLACLYNHIDIVDKLLALGINVNITDSFGTNALYYCESVDLLHRLYIYGADFNNRSKDGDNLLHMRQGNYSRNATYLSTLINYGTNVNAINNDGITPLMCAVLLADAYIVSVLLKAGADVNIQNNDGKTAKDYAVENNHQLIVSLLCN